MIRPRVTPGGSSDVIGQIRSLFGVVTVVRANGKTEQVGAGDILSRGDLIETGADGRVGITFSDGTLFNLSSRARMSLDEFVCTSDGHLNSALFNLTQGTFAFVAGRLARNASLAINTPFGTIRGAQGGLCGVLTLVALTLILLRDAEAAILDDTGFPLDDIVRYQDLQHGTFEIVTKEAVPRVIVVDDPEATLVVRPTASGISIQQVANTSSDMAALLAASHDANATYLAGQADPFTTGAIGGGRASLGSGGPFEITRIAFNPSAPPPPLPLGEDGSDVTFGENTPPVAQPVVLANPTAGTAATAVADAGPTGGSGTLGFNFGGGGVGSIGFASMNGASGVVGQESVIYSWDGSANTLTATVSGGARSGTPLFKVVVDPTTGAFTVTLLDNVIHAPGPNDGSEPTASLTYTVTDGSGASTTGILTVTFDDDVPTATPEASQNVAEGATVAGTLDFVAGADGASVTHVNGTLLTFGGDGYSQVIDIGAGTIKVKADGSYSFTADNATTGSVPVNATYTVTDGDGDTATASIAFQVTDANVPTGGIAAATVDDDGLTGGNAASTADDINANAGEVPLNASEAIYTGTLGGSVGLDTPGVFSFAALDGTSGTVGTETVIYSWAANILTATGPRGVLFTVEVTNPATGAYTVTLRDNVLHATGPNDENAPDPTTSLAYTITDADSSVANGTLTITFDDDAPTASAEASQNVAEGATVAGTLDFVAGADGASVTHVNGSVADVRRGRLLAGDRHRRRHHQGEGGRLVLVHG